MQFSNRKRWDSYDIRSNAYRLDCEEIKPKKLEVTPEITIFRILMVHAWHRTIFQPFIFWIRVTASWSLVIRKEQRKSLSEKCGFKKIIFYQTHHWRAVKILEKFHIWMHEIFHSDIQIRRKGQNSIFGKIISVNKESGVWEKFCPSAKHQVLSLSRYSCKPGDLLQFNS